MDKNQKSINCRSNKAGFSFMELMVVVAIIAILIAASMPVFRSFARGRNLRAGSDMVMSALRKSREAAITYRKHYRAVLDTVNQAVGIYLNENGVDTVSENWQKLPEFVKFDDSTSDWKLSTSFSYPPGGDIYWIEFKPNGGCTANASIILLEESTSDTKRITFNSLTGRVTVE